MSKSDTNSGDAPLETIRLNARDRKALINKINASSSTSRFQAERRALRVDFEAPRILFIAIQATGNQVRHAAVPRNLSKRGLAFILGRYVYPDTDCKVAMPTLGGEWLMVTGKVRLCRHVGGIFHETAVVFEEPVDLRDFVQLSREEEDIVREELAEDLGEGFEEVEQTQMILVVDDDKANRRLLTHWLGKLNLRSRDATSPSQVTTLIKDDPPDGILMDVNLGEFDGLEIVQTIRNKGYKGPVICVSADESEATRQRAMSVGCNGYLPKPYTLDQIQEALEGAMAMQIGGEPDEPILSTLIEDESMLPLLRDFVKTLNGLITKLNEANGASDYEQIERVCQQLKGAGGSYGYEAVTEAAKTVLDRLQAEDMDLESIHGGVGELIRTLRRVRVEG